MTVVNPKSISGINSITTGSGSDDILTIHTNNGTERLRIDSTGTTKIVTGIVTTLTATTGIVTTLTANTVTSLGAVSGTTGTFSGQIFQTSAGSATSKITLNNASDTTGMDVGYSESSGAGFINVGQSGSGLSIKTGGTAAGNERLTILSAGDVGINSTAPQSAFDVLNQGQTGITDVMLVKNNSAGNSFIRFQDNDGTSNFSLGADDGSGLGANAFILYDRVNSAYRMGIDNSGNMKLHSGNLVIGTAGKGIDFAAETPSGAGSANTVLDDYEEGTFTMTMSPSSSGTITLTPSIDSLRYTKIGNLVTIHGRVRVESVSSPSGGLQIGGLPFASVASNSGSQDGYQHFGVNTHGVNIHDSTVQLFGELASNATGAGLFQMFDNSNWGIMSADLIQGNQNEYFGFSFFYHTAT